MIPYKQLSLADIFIDCQNKFDNDKYQFFALLENTINLDEIVPASFVSHFHAATGRPRRHLLYPILEALLLQLIFSLPTTSLLIVFLKKSGSPDEDKSLADSKALIPVLIDFFQKHPLINLKIFLGDAAFDSVEIPKYLL